MLYSPVVDLSERYHGLPHQLPVGLLSPVILVMGNEPIGYCPYVTLIQRLAR